MRRAAFVLVVVVAGCGGSQRPSTDLARLEAARDPAAFAGRRDPAALRALGRIGGPEAVAELRRALADKDEAVDEAVVVAALEGLWFADEPGTGADVAPLVSDPRRRVRLAAVRALGRLAAASEEPAVVSALVDADPAMKAAGGIAAGVMGRRKVATDATLLALVENASNTDADVRRGAAYGLSYHPASNPGALIGLCDDKSADVRALAYGGLARAGQGSVEQLARGLDDASPWVRVEAARALSTPKSSSEAHARLAAWLEKAPEDHATLEGLERLGAFAKEEPVRSAMKRIHARGGTGPVACLAAAALARGGEPLGVLDACNWERARLLALAVKDRPAAEALPVLAKLAHSGDVRERAAAGEMAPAFLPDAQAEELVKAALDDKEPAVAGSAADALGALGAAKVPSWVVPTLIERAKAERERDPELYATFLDALVALEAKAALPLAAGGATGANATVRSHSRTAYKALAGEEAPAATPLRATPPPVDLAAGGQALEVTTTKGTFTVELDRETAPWATAALVGLARRGFFDGVLWHRVVPGFVVQGGDPGGTGWGGPGFNLPAEMSALPYVRGTVGMADAGRDTAGSQWFIMHAAAPHLDGRYTVVGHVREADMAVVDKLLVGDRMLKVRVK